MNGNGAKKLNGRCEELSGDSNNSKNQNLVKISTEKFIGEITDKEKAEQRKVRNS